MKRIALPLILTLLAGTACWPFGDDALPDMSVKRVSGRVDVLRDGEVMPVEGEMSIEPGDIIKTSGSGSQAKLRLQGDRFARLKDSARAEVVNETSLESLSGSLLADAGEPTTVGFEEVEAAVDGAILRIDRGFASAKVATYAGAPVPLAARGQAELMLDPLFQVSVSTTDLPSSSTPYQLKMDVWDEIYLDEIVELEDRLGALGRGLASTLDSRPTLDYFNGLSGGENVRFMRSYLRDARPVDLLIGFSVAMNDRERSLASSFRDAFDLFETGARWGVVAGILEVRSSLVLADLESIVRAARIVADGGGEEGLTSEADGELAAGDGPTTDPGDPQPNPTRTGSVQPSPEPTPSPSPSPNCDRVVPPPECLFGPEGLGGGGDGLGGMRDILTP